MEVFDCTYVWLCVYTSTDPAVWQMWRGIPHGLPTSTFDDHSRRWLVLPSVWTCKLCLLCGFQISSSIVPQMTETFQIFFWRFQNVLNVYDYNPIGCFSWVHHLFVVQARASLGTSLEKLLNFLPSSMQALHFHHGSIRRVFKI